MRAQSVQLHVYGSASIHSQFGTITKEVSVGLGSYMDQKAVKNEGGYLYQFCGRLFDKEEKEEEEEEEELVNFCIVVYFTSFESTGRYITIC